MTLSGVVMAQTTQPAPSKPKAATAEHQTKPLLFLSKTLPCATEALIGWRIGV